MKQLKKIRCAVLAVLVVASGAVLAQNDKVSFPDLKDTYLKTGDFINVENLKNIGIGQSYHQVRLLLGNPHFTEGLGSPSAYNYAFNFYTNQPVGEYITCQYQVQFNDQHRVSGTFWKEKQCENWVMGKAPVVAPALTHPIRLSADGLFAFGKSGFNDLQAMGRQNLQELAGQLRTGYSVLRAVNVVGFTDRIGRDQANQALSLARANTVKQFLVQQGINADVIHTTGMGASNPVVMCNGLATAAVIQCLMPNRRIEVTVVGEK